jgi:predicted Zn-dependent peptidase
VTVQLLSVDSTPAGIPVIVEVLPHARSVATAICIGTGSRDEPGKDGGISHFLEHMLFKGTISRSYKEVNETIEEAGGYLNAFTTHEMTAYYALTMDETLETGQMLLEDLFKHPLMAEEHIELERGVVKQELNNVINDPDMYIRRLLIQSHFGEHPLALPILGSEQSVDSFTREELLRYHLEHYRPPNLAVVVAGNVKQADIVSWAARCFDEEAKGARPSGRTAPKHRSSIDIYPRNGDHTYVGIGLPGLEASNDLTAVQDVLCTVLSGGSSSRFNHRIREEEGLVYSISTSPVPYVDCGTVDTYFSTTSERAERVMQLFAEELRKFKAEGLRKGEIERAKRIIKGAILRTVGQPRDDMKAMVFAYMETGRVRTVDEVIERVESVTSEQVLRFADELLRRDRMCAAIHASLDSAKPVAEMAVSIDF